jgi:hypothetical protein
MALMTAKCLLSFIIILDSVALWNLVWCYEAYLSFIVLMCIFLGFLPPNLAHGDYDSHLD